MRGGVIGREREIAEASGFLAEASERTCALLVAGEPGIGKTTIWSALVDGAGARGSAVLTASPSEAEAELPFAMLTDIFGRVDERTLGRLPELQREALEQALRRRRTSRNVDPTAVALGTLGVLRFLSEEAPVVVAIDDLQWVDAPSLRALSFAFRRLDDAPVALVATVRTELESGPPGTSLADAALSRRIELAGLDHRHLAELVLERTGRALTPPQLGKLAQLSGGNPFYALELAATGDAELGVPDTLAAALRIRLSALPESSRRTGLTVATLGRVDELVIRRLHGAGLDELRAAGVVDDRHGAPWFAHPLLASTLLEMHTPEEQRMAHLALATALDDPDERALHLGRGTDVASSAVAAELEQAATRVASRGAPEIAAVLAERAVALTPEADAEAATRRTLMTADLYQAAGDSFGHVLPLLERLASTLTPGADHGRVLVRLGWLGAQQDTIPGSEAIALQQRALDEAGDTPDVAVAAHAVLARMLGNAGDYGAAHRHAELAASVVEAVEPNLMFPSPHGELGVAKLYSGNGFDERVFEQGFAAEAPLERLGEPYQSGSLQLALALLYTGQLSRARDVLHELLELSVELGRVRSAAGCFLHLVELEVRAGRVAEAESHASEFVHLDRQLRGDLFGEWYPSGLLAVHLGRTEDARRILRGGIEYCRAVESRIWLAHQLWALGHLELAVGNLDAARELLVPLTATLRQTGLGEWAVHPVHPDAIETLVGLGEIEEAESLVDELEEYGRRLDRAWGLATAARSRVLVATARGADEEALEAAERALAEHARLDWPFEHARTLLATGVVLRRLGRRRDAAELLDKARTIFASLRNPLWLARVEAEERRLGGRRKAGDSLTPTETRVAELAGQGLRNAEIAARLFVTPKTVEATLSRVYRKLEIRSRTELARRLSDESAG